MTTLERGFQLLVKKMTNDDGKSVRDFYNGKKVLVTGGTGFLGKILIEKLLSSTQVDTIYVLIREKRGQSVESRLDDLLEGPVFERLLQRESKFKHKVCAVSGDCSLAGLGLNIKDVQKLIDNVHVVFHSAATVRFDERLDKAFGINVAGTKSIVNLCHQMKNLQALVHVSTAYSNCHLKEIDEQFYDYQMSYEDVGLLLAKLDEATIERQTHRILGPWPNTYTFTKALSESVVRKESSSLPACVFRPSIVMPTYKEPMPGWSDNFAGPSGASTGVYSGFLKVLICDTSKLVEIVPVDICVNGIIVAAWQVATKWDGKTIKIYNNVSSTENPITWGQFATLASMFAREYPPSFLHRSMDHICTSNKWLVSIMKLLNHFVPALLVDFIMLLTGRKPWMCNLYNRIHKYFNVTAFFALNSWRFRNENMQQLRASLSPAEGKLFPLSIREVHWFQYFHTYVLGIRKYLLKDSEETISKARIRYKRIESCNFVLTNLAFFLLSVYFWTLLQRILY